MSTIIGREEEQAILEGAIFSNKAEFIALYGRRRVGKTHLVSTSFEDRKDVLFFKVTGIKDGSLEEQLKIFADAIGNSFVHKGAQLEASKNWYDAFKVLTSYIDNSKKKKIVLFFDEFPWMVTPNSKLLKMLEHYYNNYWGGESRITLIICGSSSSWILTNIINNKGGLYGRVTESIHLRPFTLYQTKCFLEHEKIDLNNEQILQLYMVLGGIPYYLTKIKPGLSAAQSIENLAFNKDSFLMTEFSNLYATLFNSGEGHIELARIIASHRYGIGQEDLTREAEHVSSGGGLTKKLKELEEAGFIQSYKPFLAKKKGLYYKMIDEYSLFYFNWIEPIRGTLAAEAMERGYWRDVQQSQRWHSWAGYAFESVCFKHIREIRKSLNLKPFSSQPGTWRYSPQKGSKEDGAQIDLLFDRNDGVITLCEIKYTKEPFVIDKDYAARLAQKKEVFKKQTKTKKQLFWAFVSANGLKKTLYSQEMVSAEVTLNDFFRKIE